MKISKKLLSLLICLAMLITMMPTVLADTPAISVVAKNETTDLTLFHDGFESSGDINVKSISAAYNANYKTMTELKEVQYDQDNTVLNVVASIQDATKSNYAEARCIPTSQIDVSSGQFSISYDICINNFTTTTSSSAGLIKLSATTVPGVTTGTSNINRTVYTVSTNDTNAALVFGTGTRLEIGKWYSVKHYFDVVAGVEYMTVTDENGVTSDPHIYSAYDVTAISRFALSFCLPSDVYLDNITIKSEGINISGIDETISADEDVSFNATLPANFDSALIFIDGEIAGNIVPVSDKNSYDITIPAGTLDVGNREIMISASYPDGRSRSNKADTLIVKNNILGLSKDNGTAISTEVQTFDSLYKSATTADDGTISIGYNAMQASGWMSGDSGLLMPGPSGEDGDYALLTLNTINGRLLQLVGVESGPVATEGIVVFEFDLWISSAKTSLRFYPYGSTGSTFMEDNVILGGATVNGEEWTPIRLAYSIAEKSAEVTVGTTTFTYDKAMNFKTNFRIQTSNGTIFAIDNARVYNIVEDATVTSASYDSTATTNKAIPANATTLNLTLSDTTLAPTLDDVELYADGIKVNATAVSAADGVVAITLPALTANTDLDVVIKNTVDGLENNITETFYVTDASGYFIKSIGVVKSGDSLIGVIRHMGNSNFTAVTASYNANELTAVKTSPYKYDASHASNSAKIVKHAAYNTVLTPSSADSAKVMAWDTLTSATPKITSPLYNVD